MLNHPAPRKLASATLSLGGIGLLLFIVMRIYSSISSAASPAQNLPLEGLTDSFPPLTPTLPPYPPPFPTAPLVTPIPQTPIPPPLPTLPPGLSIEAGAIFFVSQRQNIPPEYLVVVDAFTITLPLTQKTLWQGFILDRQATTPLLYEVLVDENAQAILTGSTLDPQSYWQAEESAFRVQNAQVILDLAAQQTGRPLSELRLASGVLRHYPLSGYLIWEGKVKNSRTGQNHTLTVTYQGQAVDVEAIGNAENEARLIKYGKLAPELC